MRLATEASGRRRVLRAVAAVYIRMTVETSAAHRTEQRSARRSPRWQAGKLRGMPHRGVAVLAQERRPRFQQVGYRRTMRLVADGAVFCHRLMVVHEGSALFHVALIAGFHHAAAHHLLRVVAMHVVAVGAAHLAFEDGVTIGLVDLNPLLFVTGEADLRLRQLVAHFILGMQLMAGSAGDIATGMYARLPVHALRITLVTAETDPVLDFRGDRFRAEVEHPAHSPAAARLDVRGAVAMTGGTLSLAGRCSRIGFCAVFGALITLEVWRVTGFADIRSRCGTCLCNCQI